MTERIGLEYVLGVLRDIKHLPEEVKAAAQAAVRERGDFVDKCVRDMQWEAPEILQAKGRELGLVLMTYLEPVFIQYQVAIEDGRNAHRFLDEALRNGIARRVESNVKSAQQYFTGETP